MAINDIGYSYFTALICRTNRPASGTNSRGKWNSPEGERVSEYNQRVTVQGLVSSSIAPMTVRLYRIKSSASPPEGIYHCMIRDNVNTIHRT